MIWKVRQIVLIVIFHVQESSRYGALLCIFLTYSWKRLVFLVSWSFLQRHLWLWRRKRWRRILDWPWEKWKSFKSLLWHDQSRWWVLVFYSYHWKDLHPQIRLQDGWLGARSSRSWDKEGARSPKKKIFLAHRASVSSKSKEGGGGGGEAGYPGPLPWIRHCIVIKSRKFRHHKHVCSVWHDLSIFSCRTELPYALWYPETSR